MNEVLDIAAKRIDKMFCGLQIETDQVDNCVGAKLTNPPAKRSVPFGFSAVDSDMLRFIPPVDAVIRIAITPRHRGDFVPARDQPGHEPRAYVSCCSSYKHSHGV